MDVVPLLPTSSYAYAYPSLRATHSINDELSKEPIDEGVMM